MMGRKINQNCLRNYIDDETFELLESNIPVKLGIYSSIYEQVLIRKKTTDNVGLLCANALTLYFDYNSENGSLAKLVRDNADKGKSALTSLLLENSKEYGLSDLQAERIINSSLPK